MSRQVSKRSTEALEVVTGRRALDTAVKDDIAAVRAAAARSGLPDTPLARTLELLGKLVDRLCIQSATKHKEVRMWACMHVKEVHTAMCRHYPSDSLCEKREGGVDVRTRSESPQYQTYQR